jgi:lipoprotein-anchoring transpeptidase ErfK/SrfK
MTRSVSRRFVVGGLPLLIAGCATSQGAPSAIVPLSTADPHQFHYGPIAGEPFAVDALDLGRIDPELLRREVAYSEPFPAGTLVVNIAQRRLYLVQANGSALRYGIGVGRKEALNFQGSGVLARKSAWPAWTPTRDMIATIPRYAAYTGGMPGGPENPLGARALYIYRDGVDTHFRVHGTNAPRSIGRMVSSGCIRLLNHDIIDLYDRVPVGTPIVAIAS